jgi:branched-chain amino acid transport system substrate-binding protein
MKTLKAWKWLGGLMVIVAAIFLAGAGHAEDYKIGYVTDLSGPLAGSYTPVWEGFELYMKQVNDSGGVNGRKIKLFLDDDGSRADRAVADAKKQAERDGVLAIYGLSVSSTHSPVYAEMRKVGVPVVASFSGVTDALPPAKPYSYSIGTLFEVSGEALGALVKSVVPKGKVVGLAIDTTGGHVALHHNKLMVESLGYTWDEVVCPIRTSDFTSFAQTVAGMKPAAVVTHYGAEHNLGMIPALRKAGYDGPVIISALSTSEDTIRQIAEKAGSGKNIYIVTRYVPFTDDTPGTKALKAAAAKYKLANPTLMHVTGWGLGKFAVEALAKCGPNCTRESLDKTIQKMKVETDGLSGGAIEMSPTDHYGPSYWRLYRWDQSKLVAVEGWYKKVALKFPSR